MARDDSPKSTPYWQNEQAFKDAVSSATTAAVELYVKDREEYERKRPVWMLIVAILVGVVLGAGMAIPVTIIVTNRAHNSERQSNIHNERENCKLVTGLAGISATAYAQTLKSAREFEHKSTNRLGLSDKDFKDLLRKSHKTEQDRLTALRAIAHFNCVEGVK
jgi:hypothetical protein